MRGVFCLFLRLWVLLSFLFADVTCFQRSVSNCRDASFSVCGQISRFVFKLCSRCFSADSYPSETEWYDLITYKVASGSFLNTEQFLHRLKLTSRVSSACKLKAERVHFGKQADKAVIAKTADDLKEEFADKAKKYVRFFLEGFLNQSGVASDIVKGLACFDPYVLFKTPHEFSTSCFEQLYTSFRLRRWVLSSNASLCREQYLELIDYLRNLYPSTVDPVAAVPDLIDFMVNLTFLQNRPNLLHLFRLSCLCLTNSVTDLPPVVFGEVDTSKPHCRLTDVILPAQSFLSGVPESISVVTSDSNLTSFLTLSTSFGRSAFAENYDPWQSVDNFGRARIYRALLSAAKTKKEGPKVVPSPVGSDAGSSVADASMVKAPGRLNRKRLFGSTPEAEVAEEVNKLRQCFSKE